MREIGFVGHVVHRTIARQQYSNWCSRFTNTMNVLEAGLEPICSFSGRPKSVVLPWNLSLDIASDFTVLIFASDCWSRLNQFRFATRLPDEHDSVQLHTQCTYKKF